MKDLRPLLPATMVPPKPNDADFQSNLKRKRLQMTKVACNGCRTKKVACDGQRPGCGPCQKRGTQCVYISEYESETSAMALKRESETLKETFKIHQDFLHYLRTAPEDAAWALLQQLRATDDVSSVLRSVPSVSSSASTSSRHVSDKDKARDLSPQVECALDFEQLGFETSPGPESYTQTFTPQDSMSRDISEANKDFGDLDTSKFDPQLLAKAPDSPIPHGYYDQQLSQLNLGFWTAVPVSNQYAAEAISMYLEIDHPVLGLFDSDLFVDELVHCKLVFCSPFLVSSLLSFASQMYASKHPEASARSHQFQVEATNLWRSERANDSLTALAGLHLLSQSYGSDGQTGAAEKYLTQAYDMARRLKLYGVADRISTEHFGALSQKNQRATAYTAWGAFNVMTMQALFFLAPVSEYPPALPIPGNTYSHRDGDDGTDVSIPLSSNMGQTFTAFCAFLAIVSETLLVYRPSEGQQNASLAFAYSKYNKLVSLADGLGESMTCGENNASHVLVYHIWYHVVIIDIFRPFNAKTGPPGARSPSNLPSALSPGAICVASVKQLKVLILKYQDLSAPATHSLFWHIGLLYVANAVLADTRDAESRFYFWLCIRGYQTLFLSFPVAEGIARGLLVMAVRNGTVTSAEAQGMIQELRGIKHRHAAVKRACGNFVVDLDLALTDHKAAQIDNLTESFEDISMFNEFTQGVV